MEKKLEATDPVQQTNTEAEVVVYCTSWCPGCRMARAYLQRHSIPYVEIDISRDRKAAAQVRVWANGNETTPTFNIRGKIIVDFDQAALDQVFGFY